MAIITWNKFDPATRLHKPVGDSVTVPGQGTSLGDLIERYSKGEYIPPKPAYYGDDLGDFTFSAGDSDYSKIKSMYENYMPYYLPEKEVVNDAPPSPAVETPAES